MGMVIRTYAEAKSQINDWLKFAGHRVELFWSFDDKAHSIMRFRSSSEQWDVNVLSRHIFALERQYKTTGEIQNVENQHGKRIGQWIELKKPCKQVS